MRSGPAFVVDRYAIFDEIASGGMATVHLGRLVGTAGFSRTVAIKRMHRHVAQDPDFVSMFLDEARIVARIRHPNVVPTLDVVSSDGELFLVMEYIQGESLNRLLRLIDKSREPIDPRVIAAITVGVLRGLHAAHQATSERGEPLGIVHRDVSPQNIMIGIDGVPRVLDFGVAKARGRVATTQKGQLKGKLAYMSPEQVKGESIDHRSDVFAAGVVMWELLCRERLFDAENEAVIIKKLQELEPPAPSSKNPGLADFDRIVARALAREPSDRYGSARAMADDIERSLPVASASDVGDWVQSVAGKALAKRAARVAEIEAGALEAGAAARASWRASTPAMADDIDEATEDESDREPEQLGATSSPSHPSSPSSPSSPRSVSSPSSPSSGNLVSSPSSPSSPGSVSSPSSPSSVSSPSVVSSPSGMSSSTVSNVSMSQLAPPLPTDRARQLLAVGVGVGAVMALMTLGVLVIAKGGDEEPVPGVSAGGLEGAARGGREQAPRAEVPVAVPAPEDPETTADDDAAGEADAHDEVGADPTPSASAKADEKKADSSAGDTADSAPEPPTAGAAPTPKPAGPGKSAKPPPPPKTTPPPPPPASSTPKVKPPPTPTDYGF